MSFDPNNKVILRIGNEQIPCNLYTSVEDNFYKKGIPIVLKNGETRYLPVAQESNHYTVNAGIRTSGLDYYIMKSAIPWTQNVGGSYWSVDLNSNDFNLATIFETYVIIPVEGLYNINSSVNLYNLSGAKSDGWCWLKLYTAIDDSDISYSYFTKSNNGTYWRQLYNNNITLSKGVHKIALKANAHASNGDGQQNTINPWRVLVTPVTLYYDTIPYTEFSFESYTSVGGNSQMSNTGTVIIPSNINKVRVAMCQGGGNDARFPIPAKEGEHSTFGSLSTATNVTATTIGCANSFTLARGDYGKPYLTDTATANYYTGYLNVTGGSTISYKAGAGSLKNCGKGFVKVAFGEGV